MSNYDNSNSGALFRNDKQGNDNWPDYRGQAEVGGVQYWVSAWINESKKDGTKFMSLKFQPKQAAQHKGGAKNPPAQRAAASAPEFDDSIPF